jgi:Ca-activated chloride channel homolog
VAGVFLLAVSVLGPVRGFTQREVRQRGLDLVLCIDTSRSMLARDVKPNRLDRAKREVRGLLDRLAGDRVALIGFSGRRSPRCSTA